MSGYLNFPKLKGSSNYSTWVIDAQSALILHGLWSVVENDEMSVVGTAIGPATSSKPEDKAVVMLEHLKTSRMKEECQKAWALMNLIVEPAVRECYKDINNPFQIWRKFEGLFAARDWHAKDQILKKLNALDSTKYRNLHDYAREVKRYKKKMTDLGATVPEWMYLSFFRLGLEKRYRAFVYVMDQCVNATGTEADIDKLRSLSKKCKIVSESNAKDLRVCNHGKNDEPSKGGNLVSSVSGDHVKCYYCKGIYKGGHCWYKNQIRLFEYLSDSLKVHLCYVKPEV